MTKAEEFRLKARDAEREAERLSNKDPIASGIYRDIATKWYEMAKQAERQGW